MVLNSGVFSEFSSEFLLHAEVTSKPPFASKSSLAAFVATDSSPTLLRIRHFGDENTETVRYISSIFYDLYEPILFIHSRLFEDSFFYSSLKIKMS